MNLENNPSAKQLRDLIAHVDDSAGDHLLWVKRDGSVEIALLPQGSSAARFEQHHPEMQLRYEPFQAGNDYVGPDAADDEIWISELVNSLRNAWHEAKGKPEVISVDLESISYAESRIGLR